MWRYSNTNTISAQATKTFATYRQKKPHRAVLLWCVPPFESELLTDVWTCHSLLFFGAFRPRDSRASEKGSDGEGVKESFSLIQWTNLSGGPPHALISALHGDKIFEQSFLSIYFLTVQTYIQSESHSVGGVKCASTTLHTGAHCWLKSTDSYFGASVMDYCLTGVRYNDVCDGKGSSAHQRSSTRLSYYGHHGLKLKCFPIKRKTPPAIWSQLSSDRVTLPLCVYVYMHSAGTPIAFVICMWKAKTDNRL